MSISRILALDDNETNSKIEGTSVFVSLLEMIELLGGRFDFDGRCDGAAEVHRQNSHALCACEFLHRELPLSSLSPIAEV